MTKHVRLIMVTQDNHNKFYNMDELDNGTFIVKYGRIDSAPQIKTYPIGKWEATYKNKINKGYKDITELKTVDEKKEKGQSIIHDNKIIVSFVEKLLKYASQSIQKNYKISSNDVTGKMIEKAQDVLNSLLLQNQTQEFNDCLLELFSIIPRKMKKVKDYLSNDVSEFSDIIKREQDTLDVLAGQVSQNETISQNTDEEKESSTLLESLGIEMYDTDDKENDMILSHLGGSRDTFKKAIRVVNKKTQIKFNDKIEASHDKDVKLLWHGSRNENWWSIINSGLMLRPTNAIITGKMFGYGLYFANKASKSIGYTSLSGSRWASGKENNAYLALYSVHLGKKYIIKKHTNWHYSIDKEKLISLGNFDSVYAKGGADLINDEFIVYDETQSTISYIVEIVKK